MDKQIESQQYKFYRSKPVREFELNQTMYNLIWSLNQDNLNLDAIGFLGKNISYKQLQSNVDRLADAYSKQGVKEGEVVAICTINMPIVQENLLALSKIGATSKWIDLRNKGRDLIKNINESDCRFIVIFEDLVPVIQEIISETNVSKVLVASPKDFLNPVVRLLAEIKDQKIDINKTIQNDKRFIKYNEFIKTGSSDSSLKPVSFQKDRPSIIVQSSGSTGKAKSIIHTEYNFNSSMQKEAYTDLPLSVGKVMHVSIPPFIIYGLNNCIYASMVFGMKAEMTPFVSETTVFDDLGKFDFACAAPLHYRYLYNRIIGLQERIDELEKCSSHNKKELNKYLNDYSKILKKLSRVRTFVSGGDKITAQELLLMEQLFDKPIINGYGNNELTGAAIISPVYACKPDSVGIPMKGISVAAFDPDTNEKLEYGIEGEICINSDNVFVEYLNNKQETKKIKQIHSDGSEWIHTGDIGFVDLDGYVYINGRSKRLIKKEAFKISPDTIENVILSVNEVKDCVVVGAPDIGRQDSSVPMAFVELYPEFIDDFNEVKKKIEKKCIDELPDYENPQYIISIEKIPYNNGKHAFRVLEKMGEEYIDNLKQNTDVF